MLDPAFLFRMRPLDTADQDGGSPLAGIIANAWRGGIVRVVKT